MHYWNGDGWEGESAYSPRHGPGVPRSYWSYCCVSGLPTLTSDPWHQQQGIFFLHTTVSLTWYFLLGPLSVKPWGECVIRSVSGWSWCSQSEDDNHLFQDQMHSTCLSSTYIPKHTDLPPLAWTENQRLRLDTWLMTVDWRNHKLLGYPACRVTSGFLKVVFLASFTWP